jgi:hypothetical protein
MSKRVRERAGPYGANEAMEKWARGAKLRWSPSGTCLHWVSVGRCGKAICDAGKDFSVRDWMDHASGWIGADGKRVLLCQPYQIRDVGSVAQACEDFDLRAIIHANGWYGHGTVCIELTPRGQPL